MTRALENATYALVTVLLTPVFCRQSAAGKRGSLPLAVQGKSMNVLPLECEPKMSCVSCTQKACMCIYAADEFVGPAAAVTLTEQFELACKQISNHKHGQQEHVQSRSRGK